MIVVAVDPGVTTGVAVFRFTENASERLAYAQWGDPDYVWRKIRDTLVLYEEKYPDDEVVLVAEQFDQRPGVVRPDFTPKFINRDIENNITGFKIVWQIPDMAKTLVSPARRGTSDALKRFGWYLVSNGHANDAQRHAIAYVVHNFKHMPTILRGWPKPKDDDDEE